MQPPRIKTSPESRQATELGRRLQAEMLQAETDQQRRSPQAFAGIGTPLTTHSWIKEYWGIARPQPGKIFYIFNNRVAKTPILPPSRQSENPFCRIWYQERSWADANQLNTRHEAMIRLTGHESAPAAAAAAYQELHRVLEPDCINEIVAVAGPGARLQDLADWHNLQTWPGDPVLRRALLLSRILPPKPRAKIAQSIWNYVQPDNPNPVPADDRLLELIREIAEPIYDQLTPKRAQMLLFTAALHDDPETPNQLPPTQILLAMFDRIKCMPPPFCRALLQGAAQTDQPELFAAQILALPKGAGPLSREFPAANDPRVTWPAIIKHFNLGRVKPKIQRKPRSRPETAPDPLRQWVAEQLATPAGRQVMDAATAPVEVIREKNQFEFRLGGQAIGRIRRRPGGNLQLEPAPAELHYRPQAESWQIRDCPGLTHQRYQIIRKYLERPEISASRPPGDPARYSDFPENRRPHRELEYHQQIEHALNLLTDPAAPPQLERLYADQHSLETYNFVQGHHQLLASLAESNPALSPILNYNPPTVPARHPGELIAAAQQIARRHFHLEPRHWNYLIRMTPSAIERLERRPDPQETPIAHLVWNSQNKGNFNAILLDARRDQGLDPASLTGPQISSIGYIYKTLLRHCTGPENTAAGSSRIPPNIGLENAARILQLLAGGDQPDQLNGAIELIDYARSMQERNRPIAAQSASGLIKASQRWHRTLLEAHAQAEWDRKVAQNGGWLDWTNPGEQQQYRIAGWTFQLLNDERELRDESIRMNHCVHRYGPDCARRGHRIFHASRDGQQGSVELEIHQGKYRIRQAQGYRNSPISAGLKKAATELAKRCTAAWVKAGQPKPKHRFVKAPAPGPPD